MLKRGACLYIMSVCLILVQGCQSTGDDRRYEQRTKEVGVYNRLVREKHLEGTLDSALWHAYTTRLWQVAVIEYTDVLGIETIKRVNLYECTPDTTGMRIFRYDEKSASKISYHYNGKPAIVFSIEFTHIYFRKCYLYLSFCKSVYRGNPDFCPYATVYVFDEGGTNEYGSFECPSSDFLEPWVCKSFENPEVVKKMTPWLRREGVRRGYLSTDNW
jgi:hypothetical protein